MIKKIKRFFKWIFISVSILIGLIIVSTVIFVNTSPQFGNPPEGEDLVRIQKSENYGEDGFVNILTTTTGDIWKALRVMPEMFSDDKNKMPHRPLHVLFEETVSQPADSATYITWYGHSSFLIELEGKRILIDPMFGKVAAPIPFGSTRFAYQKSIPLDQLKNIDVVIISHDHYDHLDYPTILEIKNNVAQFVTPLGVGSHLKSWGVPAERITELDWWQSTQVSNIEFSAAPARHFSGRGFTDSDATQWASWIVKTDNRNIYFSGDGGYGPHFKEIGEKHGPFDFAMLECGQYNDAWRNIHMMPEETVQAGFDLSAELSMPIHWGAFRLAPHGWTESVVRFVKEADTKGLSYILPEIGERFQLGTDYPNTEWWEAALN